MLPVRENDHSQHPVDVSELKRFPVNLEQIDHIALRCASPQVTKDWYVNTLGFVHVFPDQWSGRPIFLRLGTTFIALFPRKEQAASPAEVHVSHFAFRAATYADFRQAQADLKAKGIPFEFADHEISHSIYFYDPDGFALEITTYDVPTPPA